MDAYWTTTYGYICHWPVSTAKNCFICTGYLFQPDIKYLELTLYWYFLVMCHVLCEGLDFPSCILILEFPLEFYSCKSIIWCFLFSLHPHCLPPSFSELAEESWLRNPKKACGADEVEEGEKPVRAIHFSPSSVSSIHPSIYLSTITV